MCQLVWNKANLHSNGVQGIRFQTFQSTQQGPLIKFDLWPVLTVLLFWVMVVMVMMVMVMFMFSFAVWVFGVFGVFRAFVVVLVFLILWHVHRDRHCGATDSCKTPFYVNIPPPPQLHLGGQQPCHLSPCPFLELTVKALSASETYFLQATPFAERGRGSLVPRPDSLMRRNGLANKVKFLGLAYAFATM